MSRVETLTRLSGSLKIDTSSIFSPHSVFNNVQFDQNTLKALGITQAESDRLKKLSLEERRREFQRNLKAYTNEVIKDKPVSILCQYWPDKNGILYSDPSLAPIYNFNNQFDKRERDNLPLMGFTKASEALVANPNKIVLWYSPPGSASFDNDPNNPYSEIAYDYGQLYVQYFDGVCVRAAALKVSNEEVLKQFSLEIYELTKIPDEKQRIAAVLQKIVMLEGSVEDFFTIPWENEEVYTDKKGRKHFLPDVIGTLRQVTIGQSENEIKTYDKAIMSLVEQDITEEKIRQAYLLAIRSYMQITGQKQISLSGSCGGTLVSFDEMGNLLPSAIDPGKIIGIHSSFFREITQGEQKKWGYHLGDCMDPPKGCGRKSVDVGPCGLCKICEKDPKYN